MLIPWRAYQNAFSTRIPFQLNISGVFFDFIYTSWAFLRPLFLGKLSQEAGQSPEDVNLLSFAIS